MQKLLTIEEVAELCNVAPRTIRRWCNASLFPRPFRLGRRAIRWSEEQLQADLVRRAKRQAIS